jgi:transposase
MSPDGDVLLHKTVPHTADGLHQIAQEIAHRQPDATKVRVVLELHNGALVAWLHQQGYTVYGINPKSAQRVRDRYRPSGAKDDRSDAFVLADALRVDAGGLRAISPGHPESLELARWATLRRKLLERRTRGSQRLRGLLDEWCPTLSQLCRDLERNWQRALISEFPLDADLCGAHGNRLRGFAKTHRLTERTRARLLAAKMSAPLEVAPPTAAEIRFEIRALLEEIELLTRQAREVEKLMSELLERHPDAEILRSLPVYGTPTAAPMAAGLGRDAPVVSSWADLAAKWGVAPITVQSGKSRQVRRRRACDQTVHQALLFFAFNTAMRPDCWASEHYRSKRESGVGHYAALRSVALRWVKILYRLWRDRVPYDEAVHRARRAAAV